MNTAFRYPPPVAPTPRSKPQPSRAPAAPVTTNNESQARDSNALRASVLDAALQLGLGTNDTVANWIFNNPVEEEDESPCSPLTPGLTNNDTATSEESYHYPSTPPATILPPHKVGHTLDNGFITIPREGTRYTDDDYSRIPLGLPVAFPENAPPPPSAAPSMRGKLRKKRGGGYESDGGYMSEVNPKAAKKKEKEEMKRKKSKKQPQEDGARAYDTDHAPDKGLAKSKTKKAKTKTSNEVGYETDAGYASASGKSKKLRFFGLRSKQSKQELPHEEAPLQRLPSPVVTEPIVLPIASRFATTLPSPSGTSTPTVPSSAPSINTSNLSDASSFLKLPASQPLTFEVASPWAILQALSTAPAPVLSSRLSVAPSEVPTEVPPPSNEPKHFESLASIDSGESHTPSSTGYSSSSIGHRTSSAGPPSHSGTGESHGSRPTSPASATRAYPAISLPITHISLNHKTSFTSRHQPSPGNNSPLISSEANVPSTDNTQYPTGGPSLNTSSPTTPSYPPSAMSNNGNRIPSRAPSPAPRLAIPNQTYPALGSPGGTMGPSASSPGGSPSLRSRPRNPLTEGFGARRQSVSPLPSPSMGQSSTPTTGASSQVRGRNLQIATDGLAPPGSGANSRAASPMVIGSEDFVVPSPQQVNLPSPNVLAYYDIPPPSPPPSGPLPSVPPPGSYQRQRAERERSLSGGSSNSGGGRMSRNTSGSKLATTVVPEQGLYGQPIPVIHHRGKEAPFPAKPITPCNGNGSVDHGGKPGQVGSGLEATLRVPRYRELYALALAEDVGYQERREAIEKMGGDEVERFERELSKGRGASSDEASLNEGDVDEAEMQDVLARFKESRLEHEREMERGQQEQALGRSQSIKALRRQAWIESEHRQYLDSVEVAGADEEDDDDKPITVPARRTRPARIAALNESDSDSDSDRNSRWAESMYSRASFLDPEKSEEARERFIRRVEEMYNGNGRERVAVPPVPKLA